MKTDLNGPADTRMMAIVHAALRRDLDRRRSELTIEPYPADAQKAALANHVDWMMDFLHEHHSGEDTGLYPMVRSRADGATELLDDMDADHRRIDPAMAALRAAAKAWRTGGDQQRRALVEALDELDAVLRPHLDREEVEAMPLVSRTITQREWHEWDQTYNVKSKSFSELGNSGLWMLDGLDEERRQIVLHEVPLMPRYLLLWGFGPRYRRQSAARWSRA
jgi:hemerythrin-like domain-containing protein